ncbi:hypothetical protein [Streptomyces sp. NPDC088766]|uniref:hypothetical protein n=1 Tax=Streptomyces sp. NPDC088766 TaxID=3365893 RepID=UPI0037F5857A
MLTEALAALAAAGGTAVVQAAGTSLWEGTRSRVARLFGRGDAAREQTELDRLDRTAAAVAAASGPEVRRVGDQEAAVWRDRIRDLLTDAEEDELDELTAHLSALVDASGCQDAPTRSERFEVSGNTFSGPTALQVGDGNTQEIAFGRTD